MTRTGNLLRRASALLLLGASAAAFAAPVLDAIEFHRGATTAAGLHFDQRGGCERHSERCVLRGPDSGLRFVITAARRDAWLPPTRRAPLDTRPAPAGLQASTSHQSRAPPVPLL